MLLIWAAVGLLALGVASYPVAAQDCVGDCNSDGTVTVDEVLTGVSIALGNRTLAECPSFDGNGDQQVTVDEVILALNFALAGCPAVEPTPTATVAPVATATPSATASQTPVPTPTPTVALGPVVTHFGIASAAGVVTTPTAHSAEGIPIFERITDAGFLIVVEGRPGLSGSPLGLCNSSYDEFSAELRPDVQILTNRNLGAGNPAVCDGPVGPETGGSLCGGRPDFVLPLGGIPAIDPPDFDSPSRAVADALNDFGCRMQHLGQTEACTLSPGGNPRYVVPFPGSTDQFCSSNVVGVEMRFPSGDTILTARLRDFAGNAGAPARIIVRVP